MIPHSLLLLLCCSLAPNWSAPPSVETIAARSDDEALEEAMRLRNDSEGDWAERDHPAAIAKLQAADTIYRDLPGEYLEHRAVVLRAIVWNQVRAENSDAALGTLTTLVELVVGEAELHREISSAYRALYEAAAAAEPEIGEKLLASCHELFKASDLSKNAAQTLHDRGCMAGSRQEYKAMKSWLDQAIRARGSLDDRLGLAWSLNNLAYYSLTAGDLKKALPPLGRAYEIVLAGESAPAIAVAANIQWVLDWAPESKPDRKTVQWLWSIAERAAKSSRPETISAERLTRMAHAADLRRGGSRKASIAAERLAGISLPGRPPEVHVDLMLRAIDSALYGGAGETARAWAEGLECGTGPCAPHLETRRLVLLARSHAALGNAPEYDEYLRKAVLALDSLGDSRLLRESLAILATAGEGLEGSTEQANVARSAAEAGRRGRPGGAGGTAKLSNPSSRITELQASDPVFSVSWSTDKQLVLSDLLAECEVSFDVRWKPNNHALNGLYLGVYGGYVQVRSINYGSNTPAGGSPGETTLDEWGDYRAIPTTGRLLVSKNGAISYELN